MTNAELDKPMTKYRREMLEAMPSVSKCIMPPCDNTAELTQDLDGTWGYTLYCDKCWMDIFLIDVKLDNAGWFVYGLRCHKRKGNQANEKANPHKPAYHSQ